MTKFGYAMLSSKYKQQKVFKNSKLLVLCVILNSPWSEAAHKLMSAVFSWWHESWLKLWHVMTWERFHFSQIWMAAWSPVSIRMAAHQKGFPQTSFWFCRWQTVASSPVHMLPLPWHADSIVLMTAQWQVVILMPSKMANSNLIHGRDHKPPKCCTALCLRLLIA